MSELRKEPISRRWILIAPERRHNEGKTEVSDEKVCPFCKGNEEMTPREIERLRWTSKKDSDWDLRIIPDKFALLKKGNNLGRKGLGFYDVMNSVGHHELVIETPKHGETWWDYDKTRMCRILQAYRDRFLKFKKERNLMHTVVVKSHGIRADHSMHSHSHMLGLPFVVKRVEEEVRNAEEYYRMKDRCIYCDIISEEINVGVRMVYENNDYVVFTPFASRFQFEVWIIPKIHQADYLQVSNEAISNLADAFSILFKKINDQLKNPPFSIVLHTSPMKLSDTEFYHWHWELKPTSLDMAGFEWATGLYMNKFLPEEAAYILRRANPSSI